MEKERRVDEQRGEDKKRGKIFWRAEGSKLQKRKKKGNQRGQNF